MYIVFAGLAIVSLIGGIIVLFFDKDSGLGLIGVAVCAFVVCLLMTLVAGLIDKTRNAVKKIIRFFR